MSRPVKHIVLVRFKPATTPEQIRDAFQQLSCLPSVIPGILDFSFGPNTSPEGLDQGYGHGFLFTFENAAARDAYLPHPEHQAFVSRFVPLVESAVVCDYEVT